MRHPHGLRAAAGAGGDGALTFVGGRATSSTATQTPSYGLTGLTGGLASSPSAGDIVIACVQIVSGADRDLQCTTSGYTEVADLFSDGTDEVQLAVYYKVLSAADTTVAFDLGGSISSRFCTHVWRGINTTPLDATTTTAINSSSTAQPDPPSITTVTNNAVVIAVGACTSVNTLSNAVAPSGMGNLYQNRGTNDAIMIASIARPTAGAYNPAQFTGLSTGDGEYCAATLALRPA